MRIRASYRSDLEESVFDDTDDCLFGLSFWVEFSEGWRDRSDRLAVQRFDAAEWGERVLADFAGSYHCGGPDHRGYGHENFYYCQFTVQSLDRVVRVSRSRHSS